MKRSASYLLAFTLLVGTLLIPTAASAKLVMAQPGTVGYLGNVSALTVIDSAGDVPAGTTWVSGGILRIDSASLTLDHVYCKCTIDYYGTGTLTIRQSIIESTGVGNSVVLTRTTTGTLIITDSNIVWPASVPPPISGWSNGTVHGDNHMTLRRNDISGAPDGVQQSGGNSTFQQNYIHGMRMIGVYPNNTHNDGLQLYGGPNYKVLGNYIELNGYDGTHQNSAVFFSDDGALTPSPVVSSNYISGGGFQLRFEATTSNAMVADNIFGPIAGGFGHASVMGGATIATWVRNVDNNGVPVARP